MKTHMTGSFTIEAALLIPLILAILFLLLQMILYLHDLVKAEAWLHQETWKLKWKQEWEETQDEEALTAQDAPAMAVLGDPQRNVTRKGALLQQSAQWNVRLLPDFVTVLWQGMPQEIQICSEETIMKPWRFVRLAGAIQEEWKEITQ